MYNLNEERRFYRTARDAFGSNFYSEDKEIGLSFKLAGVILVVLLLVSLL